MRFLALFIGVVLALAAGTLQAVEPQTDAAGAAIDYIRTQQNADGGFVGFGDESSAGVTIDATFALVAADVDPANVTDNGHSPLDYLETQAAAYAMDPGSAAKLAYAVSLTGRDTNSFGGTDLNAIMADGYDAGTGKYGIDLFDHVFYLFALDATNEPVPESALDYLRSVQLDDGGWEFDAGFLSDTNTTAMVVQALIAAGVEPADPVIGDALAYFASTQAETGAFAFLADTEPDAQSTALVIQALIAAGAHLDGWAVGDATPMDALLPFQNPDTGAFQFAGEDSPFATYQVVPGTLLAPFPALESLPDGGPVATATETESDDEPATPTPEPTVEAPVALPDTGTGSGGTATPWAVLALLGVGVAAGAGGLALRRR